MVCCGVAKSIAADLRGPQTLMTYVTKKKTNQTAADRTRLSQKQREPWTKARNSLEFFRGNKGALRIPFLSFQNFRRLGCTVKLLVFMSLVDSHCVGHNNFRSYFQRDAKIFDGH
jgi:hypothetical protein